MKALTKKMLGYEIFTRECLSRLQPGQQSANVFIEDFHFLYFLQLYKSTLHHIAKL